MRKLTLFTLLITVLVLLACLPVSRLVGSGRLESKNISVSDFTTVKAGGTFNVEISHGESYSVVITADDNVLERVDVDKRGSRLEISLDGPLTAVSNVTLRAKITMPNLEGVELSGASRCTITGFNSADDFRADMSGASRLDGDIVAGDATLELSGASAVELSGSAQDLRVDASGASSLNLGNFSVESADVELSGGSRATLDVTGRLDYELSGGSLLEYSGTPKIGKSEASGGARAVQK